MKYILKEKEMKKFLLMFAMFMLFVGLCSCSKKNINIKKAEFFGLFYVLQLMLKNSNGKSSHIVKMITV